LLDLGLSYDNLGNHSAAAIFYNKVIKETASNPQYDTQHGLALDGLGDHVQALKYFNQALETNPHDIFALIGKGFALVSLKNYTQAIAQFDKSLVISPNEFMDLVTRHYRMYVGHTCSLKNQPKSYFFNIVLIDTVDDLCFLRVTYIILVTTSLLYD
jgi:tetratricopeptide (TPR) repeat protein